MNMNIDSEGKGTTEGNTVGWCEDSTLCKTNGAWDNTKGPITATNYLESSTENWSKLGSEQISLPTANQIATAGNKTFNGSNNVSGLPTWLYENLNNMPPFAYWTSTPYASDSERAIYVDRYGGFYVTYEIGYYSYSGVRPVITIPKTQLG